MVKLKLSFIILFLLYSLPLSLSKGVILYYSRAFGPTHLLSILKAISHGQCDCLHRGHKQWVKSGQRVYGQQFLCYLIPSNLLLQASTCASKTPYPEPPSLSSPREIQVRQDCFVPRLMEHLNFLSVSTEMALDLYYFVSVQSGSCLCRVGHVSECVTGMVQLPLGSH